MSYDQDRDIRTGLTRPGAASMNDEKRSAVPPLRSRPAFRRFLLIAALIVFILLAGSLSNLEFRSGNLIPFVSRPEVSNQPLSSSDQFYDAPTPWLAGTISILFLVLIVYVGFELIRSADLKIIFRLLLGLAVLLAILYAIPRIEYRATTSPPETVVQDIPRPTGAAVVEVYSPGQPPNEFILLVLLAGGLGLGLITYLAIRKMRETNPIQDQLLAEVNAAVKGLQTGINYRSVIITCYARMSQALAEHKGIERNFAMTAREFEEWLEDLGFPQQPVHQLTALFEEVRYGSSSQAAPGDEAAAMECLNQIIQHCQMETGS